MTSLFFLPNMQQNFGERDMVLSMHFAHIIITLFNTDIPQVYISNWILIV